MKQSAVDSYLGKSYRNLHANSSFLASISIVFRMMTATHDVVTGDFGTPCNPGANSSVSSGFHPPGTTFTVTVNDTNPIYYYCSARGHCQGGMVGAINAP